MSLKEHIPKIYQSFGLSEMEVEVYLVFFKYTQCTVSEVAGILNKDGQNEIQPIVNKLEQLKFVHKIPGIVDRYIPLEPYLELFEKEANQFKDTISEIKDNVLMDQASRFKNLENIETGATDNINTAVDTQISGVFVESDNQDVDKKNLIDNAIKRYTDTGKLVEQKIETATFEARDKFEETRLAYTTTVKETTEKARDRFQDTSKTLEGEIETALFMARDRFKETTKAVENEVQTILNGGRDRYESTSLLLETDLHSHINSDYSKFENAVNSHAEHANKVLDDHMATLGGDKDKFNAQISEFTGGHKAQYQTFETDMHAMVDSLNLDLKGISDQFKSVYDTTTVDQKNTWNTIVDDLLKDFGDRVANLETECKKELDAHVDFHKANVDDLQPQVQETLEKYLLRMKEVVDALKLEFSGLLTNHIDHSQAFTGKLQEDLKERVEARHNELSGQVTSFRDSALELMENLKDTSDRYSGLAEDLAKRGSAWKALLFGKHTEFLENYKEIQERIATISESMKQTFEDSTADYILRNGDTTTQLKSDIDSVVQSENQGMKTETLGLDTKQNETLGLELDELAHELSDETNAIFQKNHEHCSQTNISLKDQIENSLHTHHDDYELAINKHRQGILKFDDECNDAVKFNVDQWYGSMDGKHNEGKTNVSDIVQSHDQNVAHYEQQAISNNNDHVTKFTSEFTDLQAEQRQVYDEQLSLVRADFEQVTSSITTTVHNQVKLVKDEVANLDSMQHEKLDAQIQFVESEFGQLNDLQHKKLDEQISLFAGEVATINAKQQEKVDAHIAKFKEIVHTLDKQQKMDLDGQISLVTDEFTKLEGALHELLEKRKADFKETLLNLKQNMTKTISNNILDTKDAIADFTLNFMNSIDEAVEIAEEDVAELTAISGASQKVPQLGNSLTWHVFGTTALIETIIAAMDRVKSTITIITPTVEPKVLEKLSQVAYTKKSVRFLYTTNWDLGKYGPIVEKMKVFGNIQFRNLKTSNDFWALNRDGEQIILCPKAENEDDVIAIVSELEGYISIFGSFIYPIFQANSRPI
ncbi:MAG: helix-turn-helix domain-containing protein [Promethearchaeota archaeon]